MSTQQKYTHSHDVNPHTHTHARSQIVLKSWSWILWVNTHFYSKGEDEYLNKRGKGLVHSRGGTSWKASLFSEKQLRQKEGLKERWARLTWWCETSQRVYKCVCLCVCVCWGGCGAGRGRQVSSEKSNSSLSVCVERQQRMWANTAGWQEVKEPGTHCSSPRRSCLRSRSGCHTSSGRGCSCYSRSGIRVVHRSFHLFHQEQTNTKMKMASKSMNINGVLAITFCTCNHRFLGVSPSESDAEFKTQFALERLTRRKMKYLLGFQSSPHLRIHDRKLAKLNFHTENIQEKLKKRRNISNAGDFGFVTYRTGVFVPVRNNN